MEDNHTDIPQTVIIRIVKNVIPDNVAISRDAKLAYARAAKVFIQYLASAAYDYGKSMTRSTISSNHVISALEELEFPEFIQNLNKALEEHKQLVEAKKARRKKTKGEDEEIQKEIEV